jgi:hypothetical protein
MSSRASRLSLAPLIVGKSDFLASRHIIIDSFAKGGFQSFDSIGVKADNVGDPCDMTDKYFVFAVKFDAGYITLVR